MDGERKAVVADWKIGMDGGWGTHWPHRNSKPGSAWQAPDRPDWLNPNSPHCLMGLQRRRRP
jgi:hypothetical protein